MLLCKYARRENAVFVPHLDTLRAVTMAIRRTGIEVAYSEGFNPHMKIFFGQPLPIGIESECEYFCVDALCDAGEFLRKINATLPQGLTLLKAAAVQKDPNIAGIMAFADYTVTFRAPQPNIQKAAGFTAQDDCTITFTQKGVVKTQDVRDRIRYIRATDERTLKFRLACGNVNLRADRLTATLTERYGLGQSDIVKTHMYDCAETDLDTLFF